MYFQKDVHQLHERDSVCVCVCVCERESVSCLATAVATTKDCCDDVHKSRTHTHPVTVENTRERPAHIITIIVILQQL